MFGAPFFKSFLSISGCIFGGRVTGFIREILLSALLGANWMTDMMFLSIKLPALFRRVFAEGALNNSLVPAINTIEDENKKVLFVKNISAILSLILFSIILIWEIFMPEINKVMFSGISSNEEKLSLLTTMTRISLPFAFIMFWVSVYGSFLNSKDRFVPFAITAFLNNIWLICGIAVMLYINIPSATTVVLFYTLGGIVQFTNVFYFLYKNYKIIIFPSFSFNKEIISLSKKFFSGFAPIMFSSSISQISVFIGIILASNLQDGGISYLSYADTINQFPVSMIGISLTTITISRLSKEKDLYELMEIQKFFFEFALILSITAAIHMYMFAPYLVNTFFSWGSKFKSSNAIEVSNTLSAYMIGLPANISIKILLAFFFARSKSTAVFYLSILMIILDIIFSIIGMKYYAHYGIALGVSIANIASLFIIVFIAQKLLSFKLDSKFILKLFLISIIQIIFIKYTLYKTSASLFLVFLSLFIWTGAIFLFKLFNIQTVNKYVAK